MEMLRAQKSKEIQRKFRNFDEEQDADFIRMRMLAIWEAQETMKRGVIERDNRSTFLA
jgi:hypothetical protein